MMKGDSQFRCEPKRENVAHRYILFSLMLSIGLGVLLYAARLVGQQPAATRSDAVEDAQKPKTVESKRPEQQKTIHDRSNIFDATKAPSSSSALESQPDEGKMLGFDFARDPLNAKSPMQSADEIMKQEILLINPRSQPHSSNSCSGVTISRPSPMRRPKCRAVSLCRLVLLRDCKARLGRV